uniref:Uncharacterized protein n=1 Tax=Avena sativa TaxID=4498 RepID=A0ACD5VAJ0_AVESA
MIQVKRSHMNISSPIGCCLEVDIPILVYEFSSKGSLHDNLHGNNKVPLGLGTRLRIAAYSAHGLDYMLSGPSGKGTKILHGDVKTENIFLDESFNPMVSHFGMSRLYRRTGILVNDMAYMDPVYLQTDLLTEQSDVYSFGVVILELISRKKATQSNNNRLVRKFLENHKQGRRSTELFDKEIAVTGHFELLDSLAGIAVECLDDDTSRRPTMSDVAKRLFILYRSQAN